jgi:hypothetical protein
MPPDFFSTTTIKDSEVKAFASEIVCAVHVLMSFLEHCVVPTGSLRAEVGCFRMLHKVLQLLSLGEKALPYADTIQAPWQI